MSAKYWNGDPSAINVYTLDTERERVENLSETHSASRLRVWEYDYALEKNRCAPFSFVYSWFSKFRTILQSHGLTESIRLLRDVTQQTTPDE